MKQIGSMNLFCSLNLVVLFEYPALDALVSRILFLNSLLIKADTCITPIAQAR